LKWNSRFCALFRFADYLFDKKDGESVTIPFTEIEPLIRKKSDNPLSIVRRAFRQYFKEKFGITNADRRIDDESSIMNQTCDFKQNEQIAAITVTKKKDPKEFVTPGR